MSMQRTHDCAQFLLSQHLHKAWHLISPTSKPVRFANSPTAAAAWEGCLNLAQETPQVRRIVNCMTYRDVRICDK